MYFLLTWSGNIVCFSETPGSFKHRSLRGCSRIPEDAALFEKYDDLATGASRLVPRFNSGVVNPVQHGHPPLAFDLEFAPASKAWCLKRDGLYACADSHGDVPVNRTRASGWEQFLLVRPDEVERLWWILNNSWIHKPTRTRIRPADIEIQKRFILRIGDFQFSMADNFLRDPTMEPGIGPEKDNRPLETALFRHRWAPEVFAVYRPLIYATAFGAREYITCFEVCISSALTLGEYDGDVLLLTDKAPEELTELRALLGDRLHVRQLIPARRADFIASRYTLGRWAPSKHYQPILYSDVDVAFDIPMEPMLINIALHSRLTAQTEEFSFIDKDKSVGAQLYRELGIRPERKNGFCAGIIGIPNFRTCALYFETVMTAIYRFFETASLEGRVHIDQPFFNFVAAQGWPVDGWPMTQHVRWAQGGKIHGGDGPKGVVHFWGPTPVTRTLSVMRDYLAQLTAPQPEPVPETDSETPEVPLLEASGTAPETV